MLLGKASAFEYVLIYFFYLSSSWAGALCPCFGWESPKCALANQFLPAYKVQVPVVCLSFLVQWLRGWFRAELCRDGYPGSALAHASGHTVTHCACLPFFSPPCKMGALILPDEREFGGLVLLMWHWKDSGMGVGVILSQRANSACESRMHWVERMLYSTGSWQSSALQESRDGPFEYFWEAGGEPFCSSVASCCLSVWSLAPDLAALV